MDTMSADGVNYLSYPANSGTMFEDYVDSMSITSSPSTLDGNLESNNNNQPNRLVMTSSTDTMPINQMQSSSMYDDNFISTLLNSTEPADLFDFSSNFNLSGHGGTDGCDLSTGFSYNL